MEIRAAVCYEIEKPQVIEKIQLAQHKDDEVLVKIEATGVCYSDIHVITGSMSVPLPAVLGHEGAGIVIETGKNIKHVKPGDHVALSWAPECGKCRFCYTGKPHLCDASAPIVLDGTLLDGTSRLSKDNQTIYHYSFTSTWAEYTVVPGASCVKLNEDIPFVPASLIGCAVMTGIGAVVNTAKVRPGSSVVIYGMGGVGLNIAQGARLSGAEMIIGIDAVEEKKDHAMLFGATHFINPKKEDVVDAIKELTNNHGADYVFEAIGNTDLQRQAYDITARAGTIVYIGIAPDGAEVKLPALKIPREEKIITGSFYGSANPQRDFAMIANLYQQGKLLLDELVTDVVPLNKINEAITKVRTNKALRMVVEPHNTI